MKLVVTGTPGVTSCRVSASPPVAFQVHIGHEAPVVKQQPLYAILTVRARWDDLLPRRVGMAPESREPAAIDLLKRTITGLQPGSEVRRAALAVAPGAILVAHMPEQQGVMVAVAFGQAPRQSLRET